MGMGMGFGRELDTVFHRVGLGVVRCIWDAYNPLTPWPPEQVRLSVHPM